MDLPRQKGFYDTRRQFQGKDDLPPPIAAGHSNTPPRGQLIAGLLFLALVAIAFLKFALPEKPAADPHATPRATAPKAAAH